MGFALERDFVFIQMDEGIWDLYWRDFAFIQMDEWVFGVYTGRDFVFIPME